MTDSSTATSSPTRRRRWWRWPLRIVVALPVLVAVAAQLVLWSDLPRPKVEAFLSEQSGLDVRMSHLTLRWNGHTTAKDVTVALPKSDPFATVPRLDLDHAGLLKLIARRQLDLTTVSGADATLTLREDGGDWEVQRVIASLSAGDGEPLSLPVIRLDQTTMIVAEAGEPEVTYEPMDVRVSTPSSSQLSYELEGGADTSVNGTLALDGTLAHEMTFRLEEAAKMLRPWVTLRDDARLAGTWAGSLYGAEGKGHLQLEDSTLISTVVGADLELSAGDRGRGPVTVTGSITAHTSKDDATFDAEIEVDARGDSWTRLDLSMLAKTLRRSDPRGALVLDGIELGVGLNHRKLTLLNLKMPRAQAVTTGGEFDLASGQWTLQAKVDQWRSPRFSDEFVDVEIDWHGRNRAMTFDLLRLRYADIATSSTGTFDPSATPPLQVRQVAVLGADEPDDGTSDGMGPAARIEADMGGQLFPLELNGRGHVSAYRVPMVDGVVDEIASPCTFDLDNTGLTFDASALTLFDGPCSATGNYSWDTELLAFTMAAEGMDLSALLPMVGAPMEAEGRLGATIDFALPQLDTRQLTLNGQWSVTDYRQDMISAERGAGKVTWDEGKLRLHDCRFEYESGTLSGELTYDSSDDQIDLELTASRWPLDVPETALRLLVDGSTRAAGTTAGGRRADLSGTTTVLVDGDEAGSFAVRGELDGESLRVDQLDGTLAGGRLSGSGTLPMTDWRMLDGELRWDGIDLEELAAVHPAISGVVGRAAGSARATPSTDRRFPQAVALTAHVDIADGKLFEATITKAEVDGFLDNNRQSLQRANFEIAGGTVEVSGWHDSSRSHAQVFFTADAIDCGEIETVFLAPDENTLVGRLAGRGSFTSSAPSDTLVGTATFQLTNADIAGAPVVHAIYNGLRLGLAGTEPKGRGEARVRLEGSTLEVSEVKYLNRGVGITGRITFDDITAGADGGVDGVAVGSLRPLADINLPVIRQLDTLTEWFQGVTSSVRVTGTVGSFRVRHVPFANVASELGGT